MPKVPLSSYLKTNFNFNYAIDNRLKIDSIQLHENQTKQLQFSR